MSEGTCYEKLRSLQAKGCLEIISVERNGSRSFVCGSRKRSPVVVEPTFQSVVGLEDMDFFAVVENRSLILAQEGPSASTACEH